MQWMVRYFIHKSKFWKSILDDAVNMDMGPRAYAERKRWDWHQMAVNANRHFSLESSEYESPL